MSQTIEKALGLQQQLRTIFESRPGGRKDLDTLHRVRELCTEVSGTVPDVFCKDRLAQLENFADALFADRKHQQWARRRNNAGLLSLRHRAYAALDELDRRLHLILALRRNEAIRRECNAVVRPQSSVRGSRS